MILKKYASILLTISALGSGQGCHEESPVVPCTFTDVFCQDNLVLQCIEGKNTVIQMCEGETPVCDALTATCIAKDSLPTSCAMTSVKCDNNNLMTCSNYTWTFFKACQSNEKCNAKTKACDRMPCTKDQTKCEGDKYLYCHENGEWSEPVECPFGLKCVESDGEGACTITLTNDCKAATDCNNAPENTTPECQNGLCRYPCKTGYYELDKQCVPEGFECLSGQATCDGSQIITCSDTHKWNRPVDCPQSMRCKINAVKAAFCPPSVAESCIHDDDCKNIPENSAGYCKDNTCYYHCNENYESAGNTCIKQDYCKDSIYPDLRVHDAICDADSNQLYKCQIDHNLSHAECDTGICHVGESICRNNKSCKNGNFLLEDGAKACGHKAEVVFCKDGLLTISQTCGEDALCHTKRAECVTPIEDGCHTDFGYTDNHGTICSESDRVSTCEDGMLSDKETCTDASEHSRPVCKAGSCTFQCDAPYIQNKQHTECVECNSAADCQATPPHATPICSYNKCAFSCQAGYTENKDGNSCEPVLCTPGKKQCKGLTPQTCNTSGTGWSDSVACEDIGTHSRALCTMGDCGISCLDGFDFNEDSTACINPDVHIDWCRYQYLDTATGVSYGRVLPPESGEINGFVYCTKDTSLPISQWIIKKPGILNEKCSDCGDNIEYMTSGSSKMKGYSCVFIVQIDQDASFLCTTKGGIPQRLTDKTYADKSQIYTIPKD